MKRQQPVNSGEIRTLYARRSASSTLAPIPGRARPRPFVVASFECAKEVGFNAGERCIEHFPPRHNDDVEPGRHLVTPEYFAGAALGAVALHGGAEFPCGRHAEPRRRSAVRDDEQCHEAGVNPDPRVVGAFEFRSPPYAIGAPQALRPHGVSLRPTP